MARKPMNRRLQVIHPDCAGIDVGKSKVYVAVDPERSDPAVRSFRTFTDDLEALLRWLKECGVRIVAMEATGVYWIPLFEMLDHAGFEVHLVNPHTTKQVSGRKSDVLDCQWVWQLMSYGLLKGAFRPADEICVLRSYVRQRARLIGDATRSMQHMQKALTEMNIQLDEVLSDLMGKTGQQIVRAIVAGERDATVLAQYRDPRVKADTATIAIRTTAWEEPERKRSVGVGVETVNLFAHGWPPPDEPSGKHAGSIRLVDPDISRTAGSTVKVEVGNLGQRTWLPASEAPAPERAIALAIRWRVRSAGGKTVEQRMQLPRALYPTDRAVIEAPLVPPPALASSGPWEVTIALVAQDGTLIADDLRVTFGVEPAPRPGG